MKRRVFIALGGIVALGVSAWHLPAQPAQHNAHVNWEADMPFADVPGKNIHIIELEFAPQDVARLHTHPGGEYGYVTQGTLMVKKGTEDYVAKHDGQPFSVDPKVPMTVKNSSDKIAKMISVVIHGTGEPHINYLDQDKHD
jgi:quercetin dioxygenase-like cupin family protein